MVPPKSLLTALLASARLHYVFSPDGDVKWTVQTGPVLKSSPALGLDGTVYLPSMNGKLYAIAAPVIGGTRVVAVAPKLVPSRQALHRPSTHAACRSGPTAIARRVSSSAA